MAQNALLYTPFKVRKSFQKVNLLFLQFVQAGSVRSTSLLLTVICSHFPNLLNFQPHMPNSNTRLHETPYKLFCSLLFTFCSHYSSFKELMDLPLDTNEF